MAIESLKGFIEEQLKKSGLTERERTFFENQERAAQRELLKIANPTASELKAVESARKGIELGNRFGEAIRASVSPDDRFSEITGLMQCSPSVLLGIVATGEVSPIVRFVANLPVIDKSLINGSMNPLIREIHRENRLNEDFVLTVGEFAERVNGNLDGITGLRGSNVRVPLLRAAFPAPK